MVLRIHGSYLISRPVLRQSRQFQGLLPLLFSLVELAFARNRAGLLIHSMAAARFRNVFMEHSFAYSKDRAANNITIPMDNVSRIASGGYWPWE